MLEVVCSLLVGWSGTSWASQASADVLGEGLVGCQAVRLVWGVVETGQQGLARGAAQERLEEKWVGRVSERELEVGLVWAEKALIPEGSCDGRLEQDEAGYLSRQPRNRFPLLHWRSGLGTAAYRSDASL